MADSETGGGDGTEVSQAMLRKNFVPLGILVREDDAAAWDEDDTSVSVDLLELATFKREPKEDVDGSNSSFFPVFVDGWVMEDEVEATYEPLSSVVTVLMQKPGFGFSFTSTVPERFPAMLMPFLGRTGSRNV